MPNLRSTRLFACAALLAVTATQAQTHRVEAPEKVTRAVGVYEWTGDLAKPTAARLVPVSVFIEGSFQDGGTYYARPVPLALLNGNVYSLEKAGIPQGNVTLDYARHLQPAVAANQDTNDLGWFGYGTFAALPAPRKAVPLRASAQPPVIVSSKDPDRPTFVRKNTDSTAAPAADSKTATPAASAPEDPDRPHFSKPPTASTPAPDPTDPKPAASTPADTTSTPSSTPTPTRTADSSSPANDSDRPTLRHRDPKQAEADRKARAMSSVTGVGSPDDDRDRPTMRRGAMPGIGASAPQLTGMPVALHQIVAVSDPATREPHPFAREWTSPAERADILAKLEAIAQRQLAAYARSNGAAPPPAAPGPASKARPGAATRTHHTAPIAPAPADAPLAGEEVMPYTLSYGGLPTFVYTATSTPVAASSSSAAIPERYVTLVAQQVPSGELQLALGSVTDAAHLDRTPWFRLIDAVDPDAGHRASLLFELRGQNSRQFAFYRILSATAEQIFLTNPTE